MNTVQTPSSYKVRDNALIVSGPGGMCAGLFARTVSSVTPESSGRFRVAIGGLLTPFAAGTRLGVRKRHRAYPGSMRPQTFFAVGGTVRADFKLPQGSARLEIEGVQLVSNGLLKPADREVVLTAGFFQIALPVHPVRWSGEPTTYITAAAEAVWWRHNLCAVQHVLNNQEVVSSQFTEYILDQLERAATLQNSFESPWLTAVKPPVGDTGKEDTGDVLETVRSILNSIEARDTALSRRIDQLRIAYAV